MVNLRVCGLNGMLSISGFGTVLERLNIVRRNDTYWMAKCPAHDDRTASLTIRISQRGNLLLKCHAGCSRQHIYSAIGIGTEDCMAEGKRNIAATYDYVDESGDVLYQVVRFDPKGFSQRRPVIGGWEWKLGDVRRVLYRLPQLVANATRDKPRLVWIVEGERDADTLCAHGLLATTSSGGAGKWRREYAMALKRQHVVILPDNDAPGREHAQAVADALAGEAASVRIVELPGLPEHGDVSDWLQTHSVGELKALLNSRRESGQAATPQSPADAGDEPADTRDVVAELADEIARRSRTMEADEWCVWSMAKLWRVWGSLGRAGEQG